jgi:hypothetical protein
MSRMLKVLESFADPGRPVAADESAKTDEPDQD